MGKLTEVDNVVLLFDNYGLDSQNLHTSFKLAGKDYPVVVLEDNGFLPEGVMSVYEYFLGEMKAGDNIPGKPRYFNQIKVPEYWEISANNSSGKIHDLNHERGRIFYAEPKHKRLIKVVDWLDDKGVVRSSDHYNKYGALYARTTFNAKGQRVMRSYFSAEGIEKIVENYVTRNIILNDEGIVKIFDSKKDFVMYFLEKAGLSKHRLFYNTLSTSFFVSESLGDNGKGDVLFWQEPNEEIPGNMRVILDGKSARTSKIMVQKRGSYEKLLSLGAPEEKLQKLGYIYPFKKENTHKPEVLICTNSDRIAQCTQLVEALPELHFSIVALTEMSSKLMSMDQYKNVSLYPGAKMKLIEDLFMKCDFYLDINHESEIVSAVQTAFLHNHVVLGFEETLHNANYIAQEHIYKMENAEKMITDLRDMMLNPDMIDGHIKLQHTTAMLETGDIYLQI